MNPINATNKLLALAAAVDERPTLEEIDAMLAELGGMPRGQVALGLIDALLDYRALIVTAAA
jgi:hypothetical protein